MAIKEPFVLVNERIIDSPSVSNIDDNSILAGVINAPCGSDNGFVLGPKDFLKKYTINNSIPRDADGTLINAYFCSFFAPLLVKRAWNSDAEGLVPIQEGVFSSGLVSTIQVDVDNLPIESPISVGTPAVGQNVAIKYPIDWNGTDGGVQQMVVGLVNVDKWNTAGESTPSLASEFKSNELANFSDEEIEDNELLVFYWYDALIGKGDENSSGYRLVSTKLDGINPLTEKPCYWQDILDSEDIPVAANLSGITWLVTYDESIEFGVSSTQTNYNVSSGISTDDFITAFGWIEDQADVYNISYVSSFGNVMGSYPKTIQSAADANKWFYFIDVADSANTVSAIKTWVGNLGLSESYRVMIGGSFDKSASVTPWYSKIAASSLYWQRVYSNKAGNSEFAPCFDATNGTLNFSKPTKQFSKSQREELLSYTYPINWVKYDRTNNVYYLNNNLVYTRKQNVMNEEMNVRMVNKMQRDTPLLLARYKGRKNNSKTRLDVEGLLTDYMNTSIMTQNHRPVEYQIICNETNNTDAIINANKLAVTLNVRLQGSIKYIEVLNQIFPLGVEFNS